MRRLAPSGEQVELVHGDQRAVVVEVGGALRSYEAGGAELIDGYAADELCSGGRGQPLIPWPNRLRDGRYAFDGETYQLPLTDPPTGNAIHGLVRWTNWAVAGRTRSRVTMAHVLHPQPGYPFALSLSIDYELSDGGLAVRTTATNAGERPCPYGAGAHPYLSVGGAIDGAALRAPGSVWLPADERGIPTGREPVEGTAYDFRRARPLGQAKLDTAYTELGRGGDGLARVELSVAGGGRAVTLWLDETYPYLMLFTGDSLADPARRRRGLAAEPMTCAPNAFASGEGLRRLAPGEAFTSTWGIAPGVGQALPRPGG